MNLQMLSMSKMKNNHLYLKILLILLGGDISLNLGPVNRHQIKDHKFDVFTNKDKELRLLHLKDTHRKKSTLKQNSALTKSMNMGICVVGA